MIKINIGDLALWDISNERKKEYYCFIVLSDLELEDLWCLCVSGFNENRPLLIKRGERIFVAIDKDIFVIVNGKKIKAIE